MKLAYRLLGIVLVLASSIFFIYYCIENWSSIPAYLFDRQALPRLALATVCYISSFIFTAIAWRLLLASLDRKASLHALLVIILISQFAKYIPGNIGHHLGRVIMASHAGLASGPVILTMAVEAAGAILAAIGIIIIAFTVDDSIQLTRVVTIFDSDINLIFLLLGIAALFVLPWLVKNYLNKSDFPWIKNYRFRFPVFVSLLVCFLLYCVNYLVLGSIMYLLVSFSADGGEHFFWLLTGVFAVSWIAGYVTPGAPGGLGIREAVMVLMLDPVLGSGVALPLALGLRIVTTAGDGIGFIGGLALRFWVNKIPKN